MENNKVCKCQQIKQDLKLAEQLINWVLKYFDITEYDWKNDQNEICTIIQDKVEDLKAKVDK